MQRIYTSIVSSSSNDQEFRYKNLAITVSKGSNSTIKNDPDCRWITVEMKKEYIRSIFNIAYWLNIYS